jgi:hypothetical protein
VQLCAVMRAAGRNAGVGSPFYGLPQVAEVLGLR